MKYKAVIGLEVHVELATKTKMFCRCSADYFGKNPNTYTCPVCLGLPGALPYPNKTAIEWCINIGLSLNSAIPLVSKFDRKNYFYPDLAKGYQISQYDEPFAQNGWIEVFREKGSQEIKRIGIRRVHMEEDTGKLIHADVNGKKVSLIDFNRSGVPLVEIVTEPDFENEYQVVQYLQKLQRIVRYLKVSNADMEKGDMRLEPNISLRPENQKQLPKYKVEVKNINSFRFVEKAVVFELKRQEEILEKGETPPQETRGWDEIRQKTVSQRVKEEANDYRYFPDPDIPPLEWKQEYIDKLKSEMPELIDVKVKRFQEEYSLPYYDVEILARERETADYFEQAARDGKKHNITPKQIANYIINKKIDISNSIPAEVIKIIVTSSQKTTTSDEEVGSIIHSVLSQNKQAVEDYKKGKENAIMFLVGQTMKASKIKLDAKIVKEKIIQLIKNA